MISDDRADVPAALSCINHPGRETVVRCGKCERPICVRCMIQTPVGMRCRDCARLRRLPQFDVGAGLLSRATAGGLAAAVAAWLLVTLLPYLLFFGAIAVGFAVAGAMSLLAKRRSNRVLEVVAVCNVVLGFAIAYSVRFALPGGPDTLRLTVSGFILPLLIASFIAVVRLR